MEPPLALRALDDETIDGPCGVRLAARLALGVRNLAAWAHLPFGRVDGRGAPAAAVAVAAPSAAVPVAAALLPAVLVLAAALLALLRTVLALPALLLGLLLALPALLLAALAAAAALLLGLLLSAAALSIPAGAALAAPLRLPAPLLAGLGLSSL